MPEWVWMAIPVMLVFSMVIIYFAGNRPDIEFDCDLCGRHVKTRGWEAQKAAANHVCDDCRKHENALQRHYAAIDRRG